MARGAVFFEPVPSERKSDGFQMEGAAEGDPSGMPDYTERSVLFEKFLLSLNHQFTCKT